MNDQVKYKSGGVRNTFFGRLTLLLVCMVCAVSAIAQTRTITGTISDEAGEPMTGVTVRVKGTDNATATNVEGMFSIKAARGAVLDFSFIGYLPQSISIGDHTQIDITMQPDVKSLDEVVVVAYGSQKKSSITGAISQVNSEELSKRPVSSVTAALEGNTPGISVSSSYGAAGSAPSITIRGVGTVTGTNSPLYVIDGVPFDGSINELNPEDVESMSVLKDAASAALYGNRAANGVILITTKKAKAERISLTFKTNQGWYQRGIPEYDVLGPDQWMTSMFNAVRNYQYSSNVAKNGHDAALAAATKYAQESTMDDMVKLNIYNVANDKLFMADGSINPQASILPGYLGDIDWYDQVIQNGYRGEYLFSGSGASDRSDYFFSLGYLDENGYVKNNNFSRISGRSTVNLRPTKWLRTGLNLYATYQKSSNAKGAGDDSGSYTNAFSYCRSIAPVYPVHLHYTNDGITDPSLNGQYILDGAGNPQWDPGFYNVETEDGTVTQIQTRNQNTGRHMIWENEVNKDNNKRTTLNGIAYVDFMLPYNIIATVKGSLNLRHYENKEYNSSIIGDGASNNGRYKYVGYDYRSYNLQQQLRWNYTFDRKHNVEVLLGHENYDWKRTYHYDYKTNEILLGGSFPSNFTVLTSMTGYNDTYKTESYLGRVQYNYDDRYNLEASFRRDGSSRFANGHRWGNFGSVGANWVFSNEEFMNSYPWINKGKIRADWGRVANDAGVDYYAYMALLGLNKYGGEGAVVMTQKPAYDLTWETGESWGIALETRLFNRWNFNIEYYHRVNKDLLFSVNDPASAGSTDTGTSSATHYINFGKIANYGIEINTDVDVYTNKDWTVNLGFNLTTLKNKVLTLPEAYRTDGYRSGSYLIKEGTSRYEWNTYTYCGVDMTDGNALYLPDFDRYYIQDGDNIIGTKDDDHSKLAEANWRKVGDNYYVTNPSSYGSRTYKGTALPSVYGSFQGNFRYKNFTLSALFTYSLGGKVMDGVYNSLMSFSGNPTQLHQDVLNSWTPDMALPADAPNRINTSINPQLNQETYSTNNTTSDRWLTNRNYLVLKNLNCAYRIPRKLLRKIDLQGATVSFACENVFTKTARKGMDAQMSLGGSQSNYLTTPRVYTFSLSLNI